MTPLTAFLCPFVRRGSSRGAAHRKRAATQRAGKGTRPPVGRSGVAGALRRLPDDTTSRCAPRLPATPLRPIKGVNINDLWYYSFRVRGVDPFEQPDQGISLAIIEAARHLVFVFERKYLQSSQQRCPLIGQLEGV